MSNEEKLLTIKEVAHQLRVDTTTIYGWIKHGALPAIIFPQTNGRERQFYRVRKSVVDEILNGKES